jgi:eukaryotic-like serine/threonine-protein kinase
VEQLPKSSDAVTAVARVGPGDTVAGKYLLGRVLGMGGMGIVFLAEHRELEGQVALKFLSAEFATNPEAVSRFRREAQAAAKLRSDHVVRVFDVGIHDNGLPYMVMEYLEGGDLGGLLRESGPLPIELAADLLIQTCSAVAEAHRQGIVHRDLKPSNLFCVPRVDGGLTIKVVDFGISKRTGVSASLEQGITVTGNVVGSPSYMSPEQMTSSNRIDHRTDIWSLGVVLYECLTGQLPFPATTYAEVCLKVHQEPPLPPSAHGVELPPALEAVIDRCLAKDPEQRYATVGELSAALSEFAPPSRRSSLQPATSLNVPGTTGTGERSLGPRRASGRPGRLTSTERGWAHSSPPFRGRRLPWILGASAVVSLCAVAWLFLPLGPATTGEASKLSTSAAATGPAPEDSTRRMQQPTPATPLTAGERNMAGPEVTAAGTVEEKLPPASNSPVPRISRSKGSAPTAPTISMGGAPTVSSATRAAPPPKQNPAPTATAAITRKPTTERDSKSSIWTR